MLSKQSFLSDKKNSLEDAKSPSEALESRIIQRLANAYDRYSGCDWAYASDFPFDQGQAIVDECIGHRNPGFFDFCLKAVVKELTKEGAPNPKAEKAWLFFEHLYYNGFKGIEKNHLYRDEIQRKINKLLPADIIEEVNKNRISLKIAVEGAYSYSVISEDVSKSKKMGNQNQ